MRGPDTFSLAPIARLGLPVERLCARAGVELSNALDTSDFFRLWAADRKSALVGPAGAEPLSPGHERNHQLKSSVGVSSVTV
jgi:hypothetical protein